MPKYPPNLIIRPLQPEEWVRIEKTYCDEFENIMPETPFQSIFYGVFLGDELVGFAHLEQLFHLNAVYLTKEYRQKSFVSAIFETINDAIPTGFPVVVLPDKKVKSLLKTYGFRLLGEMPVWRKDY